MGTLGDALGAQLAGLQGSEDADSSEE